MRGKGVGLKTQYWTKRCCHNAVSHSVVGWYCSTVAMIKQHCHNDRKTLHFNVVKTLRQHSDGRCMILMMTTLFCFQGGCRFEILSKSIMCIDVSGDVYMYVKIITLTDLWTIKQRYSGQPTFYYSISTRHWNILSFHKSHNLLNAGCSRTYLHKDFIISDS